jgi:Mrr N-terminal domain
MISAILPIEYIHPLRLKRKRGQSRAHRDLSDVCVQRGPTQSFDLGDFSALVRQGEQLLYFRTHMPIPDYQTLMLPLLRFAADGREHRFRDAVEKLAAEFRITDEERSEMIPSGTSPVFDNRVGWARTYLKQAGLLDDPGRGILKITERGRKLLAENPDRIDVKLLNR